MAQLSLRKPSEEIIRPFLAGQAGLAFTYPGVGTTSATPPPGFVVDRTRVKLGEGERVFQAAKNALVGWRQFQLGWVDVGSIHTPIQPGAMVAILGWALGLWWLNSCRIIYVIQESEPIRQFGFAYGTLPGHVEQGEERFLIEWDASNQIWYDILAFSRPNHVLTRIGYPLVRRAQKRFGRDSAAAMQAAVRDAAHAR